MANKSNSQVKREKVQEEVEDRSAFNCPDCKGEGLCGTDRVGNETVCTTCAGTGKVA